MEVAEGVIGAESECSHDSDVGVELGAAKLGAEGGHEGLKLVAEIVGRDRPHGVDLFLAALLVIGIRHC